jgi:hypothetical protein
MKRNRRRLVTGLVTTGIMAGALAAGGVALASTGATPAPATQASAGQSYGSGAGYLEGMPGMWPGQEPVMTAAADYLGLSPNQLQAQLRSGKSLADIAEAQGKTISGLKNALLAAMTSRINANSTLTAQQKAATISEAKDHLDAMIKTDMDMPHSPMHSGSQMTGTGSPMGGMWG